MATLRWQTWHFSFRDLLSEISRRSQTPYITFVECADFNLKKVIAASVWSYKCGGLSVGVDAADAALKSILPGSENKKGANEQHKGREGPNARAGEHNDRKASHSATTLLAGGAAATTRRKFNMFPCTQLRITFRRATAAIAR